MYSSGATTLKLLHHKRGKEATYCYIEKQITEKVVKGLFKFRNPTSVKRYDLPLLGAFNFVLDEVLYLNNIIEQDHRFIKRVVKPGLGFQSSHTAWRTLRGYEAMHMIRKGQVEGIEKGEIKKQIKFIEGLFPLAA